MYKMDCDGESWAVRNVYWDISTGKVRDEDEAEEVTVDDF